MSTRCQIKLKTDDSSTNTIYVYRHHDGYPEGPHGVLSLLHPLVESFIKSRGFDESYLLARICQAVCTNTGSQTTGAGIDTVEHGDIDFLYEVDKDGQIWINGSVISKESIIKKIGA